MGTTTAGSAILARVYCRHCANPRPLAEVAPGVVVVRHKGQAVRIEAVGAAQRVAARCGRCGREQPIAVPPLDACPARPHTLPRRIAG